MKRSSKIILSIFTPIIMILVLFLTASPKTTALAIEKIRLISSSFNFLKGTVNGDVTAENCNITIDGATINGNLLMSGDSSKQLRFKSGTIQKSSTNGLDIGYFADVEISGGNICNNTGNGIYANGGDSMITMNAGAIYGNGQDGIEGGGVYLTNGAYFTMKGGEITGNTANLGAGVYVDEDATFVLDGGFIFENEATDYPEHPEGGAIYVCQYGYFIFKSGDIYDNYDTERDYDVAIYGQADFDGGYIEDNIVLNGGILNLNGTDVSQSVIDNWGGTINILTSNPGLINLYIGNTPKVGDVVATLGDNVSATQSILDCINVTNLPSGTKLAYDGKNIVISQAECKITLVASPSGYGTVSPTSITVPYGAKWTAMVTSTWGGLIQFTVSDVLVASATAIPYANTTSYSYYCDGWSCSSSGTVTGDTTITANFKRISGGYTVTFRTSISSRTASLMPEIQPTAITTPATRPGYDHSSIVVARGTTYTLESSSLVALKPLGLSRTISFGDGRKVTLSWKNGTGTNAITYAFNRWNMNTSGTITGDTEIIAYFTQTGTGAVVVGDPTQPEQPGIEDISTGQETAFIDRRRGFYLEVEPLREIKNYQSYDICYPK